MNLEDAIVAGLPLAVCAPGTGDRRVAEIFILPSTVWFIDAYWRTAQSKPFHYRLGTVFGDAQIRVIDPAEPLFAEWRRWQEYRADTEDGRLSTPAAGWLNSGNRKAESYHFLRLAPVENFLTAGGEEAKTPSARGVSNEYAGSRIHGVVSRT